LLNAYEKELRLLDMNIVKMRELTENLDGCSEGKCDSSEQVPVSSYEGYHLFEKLNAKLCNMNDELNSLISRFYA